jgi:hypothetical protein
VGDDPLLERYGTDEHHLYGGGCNKASMRWWADRIREWLAQGRRVPANRTSPSLAELVEATAPFEPHPTRLDSLTAHRLA